MITDIKPVAWRFRIDGGRWIVVTDYAAIGFSTAESGVAPEIEELYPQSAIDTLRAEVDRLRLKLQAMHRRAQAAEAAHVDYKKLIALPPDGDGVRFVNGSFGRALLTSYCHKLTEDNERAEAERDALRDLLALVTSFGVTMLHHTHRDDVRKEFSEDELLRVVAISEPASEAGRSVESIYRQGFDAAIAAQAKDPS